MPVEDDLFRKSADSLFRAYSPKQDMSVSKPRAGKGAAGTFRKDFLSEVQNAAHEIAEIRRTEIERQIAELDGRIAEARSRNDMLTVTTLEQEKQSIENILHHD
ncbi:hypothetical protein ACFL55_00855 [Candidatus Latescibacterota bacterium]